MARLSRVLIPCAICLGCLVLLSLLLMNQKTGHTIVLNGAVTHTSQVNAETLESEVRTGLPMGSSLVTVDDFLTKRKIEHSFVTSSKIVYAIINNLKGGSILVSKSLAFQFHFDDSLKLQSVDAKVVYTA